MGNGVIELKKSQISGAVIGDSELYSNLNSKEPLFKASSFSFGKEVDPLLDVEIALRRCKRVGVFK